MIGLAVSAAGGLAYAVYRQAPSSFWRHLANDVTRDILKPGAIPDPRQWPDTGIHAAWLGHSTVLAKIDGVTLLTDPVFSRRAGIDLYVATLGIKRLVEPAIPPEKLPKIDVVLLSHAHMDHFDLPSLRRLESKNTRVVTAHATSDLLRVQRYSAVDELRWGDSVQAGPLRIQAFQVNHWGARVRSDTWRGYNGYLIESGRRRILFGGDTAITDTFRSVRTSRPFDLGIMPIGAYNPWIRAHCDPEQAMRMLNDASVESIVPVHHKTFMLGREPLLEPIERFLAAAGRASDRILVREIGQEAHLG
jgi:L-ascorbate metabolism protein UlaG (beta-lactamase superfamily)